MGRKPDVIAAIQSLRREDNKTTNSVFPWWLAGKSRETTEWFRPWLSAAGVTDYAWHGNRRTFCLWLAMAGAPMKDIQVLAGHRTLTMTWR